MQLPACLGPVASWRMLCGSDPSCPSHFFVSPGGNGTMLPKAWRLIPQADCGRVPSDKTWPCALRCPAPRSLRSSSLTMSRSSWTNSVARCDLAAYPAAYHYPETAFITRWPYGRKSAKLQLFSWGAWKLFVQLSQRLSTISTLRTRGAHARSRTTYNRVSLQPSPPLPIFNLVSALKRFALLGTAMAHRMSRSCALLWFLPCWRRRRATFVWR